MGTMEEDKPLLCTHVSTMAHIRRTRRTPSSSSSSSFSFSSHSSHSSYPPSSITPLQRSPCLDQISDIDRPEARGGVPPSRGTEATRGTAHYGRAPPTGAAVVDAGGDVVEDERISRP